MVILNAIFICAQKRGIRGQKAFLRTQTKQSCDFLHSTHVKVWLTTFAIKLQSSSWKKLVVFISRDFFKMIYSRLINSKMFTSLIELLKVHFAQWARIRSICSEIVYSKMHGNTLWLLYFYIFSLFDCFLCFLSFYLL